MGDLEQFQKETRDWLEANCPESMRTPMTEEEAVWGGRNAEYKNPDSKVWMERMAEKGWTVPMWPAKYGGGGLNRKENKILSKEMARIKARVPLSSFGIWMLGPALLEFANEEQKMEHIPKIVKGEIRWCQGYSEPASMRASKPASVPSKEAPGRAGSTTSIGTCRLPSLAEASSVRYSR